MHRRFLLSLALALAPAPALAQSASTLMAQGTRAYQNLELETAEERLRQALAAAPDSLAGGDRMSALVYLFATETLRGRSDSAAEIGRSILEVSPRFELDTDIFPPQIVDAFEAVRRVTRVVALASPGDLAVRPGDELSFSLVASSPHSITANVLYHDGGVVRVLYRGRIADSLDLRWDGRDAAGTPADPGRYTLSVTSRDERGRALRVLQVPVDVVGATDGGTPRQAAARAIARSSAQVFASAGAQWLHARDPATGASLSGIGFAGQGLLAARPLSLRVDYEEAGFGAGAPGATRTLVSGDAMLGVSPVPALIVWTGARVRSRATDAGTDRLLLWVASVEGTVALVAGRLQGFATGWGALDGHDDGGDPFQHAFGTELGVAATAGAQLQGRLSYRIERFAVAGFSEDTRALRLLLAVNLTRLSR